MTSSLQHTARTLLESTPGSGFHVTAESPSLCLLLDLVVLGRPAPGILDLLSLVGKRNLVEGDPVDFRHFDFGTPLASSILLWEGSYGSSSLFVIVAETS